MGETEGLVPGRSRVPTAEESVGSELPGDLAEAMGRVIRRLAADALTFLGG